MMLTVDSITGGNRERDLRTGFSIPFRMTLAGRLQFAIKPRWGINYATHERFKLPQLDEHVDMSGGALSRSAVLVSSSPTMAAGSWTAHGHHSTIWPQSSPPWVTRSTSSWTAGC